MAMIKNKICLVILDGWGIGEENQTNPIFKAGTPNFDEIKRYYPFTSLQASGNAIGLPWLEEGNSEVGHLTIGTGRVVYQHLTRIDTAIENGSFFTNSVLHQIFLYPQKNKSQCHLIGLLTSGHVHASYNHLIALLDLARQLKFKNVKLHLITDGRDSPPYEAIDLIKKLEIDLVNRGLGQIASLSGRFYAMDRDANWNRIEKVVKLLTEGIGKRTNDLYGYLQNAYQAGINDEFIEPALIADQNNNVSLIQSNDSVFFFNFREDGVKQLISPFAFKNFSLFKTKIPSNLYVGSMTKLGDDYPFPAAFERQNINNSLVQVLSDCHKRQLHLAESEKAPHITYFFDGLRDKPSPGEYWVILPSLKTLHYEDYPELLAKDITSRLEQAISENIYDFILVNYANPDLIGHTGNFEAGIKCAKFMDQEIKKVVDLCLKNGITLIITSDHGNLERMINPFTGRIETQHDPNPVPFYLIDSRLKSTVPKSDLEIKRREREINGVLADIAPTILNILGLAKPKEMTGQSLLKILDIP